MQRNFHQFRLTNSTIHFSHVKLNVLGENNCRKTVTGTSEINALSLGRFCTNFIREHLFFLSSILLTFKNGHRML